MIRGAFILAVGFGLGYVKGLTDGENVAMAIRSLSNVIGDISADKQPDIDGDVVSDEPTESDNDNEELNEGETDGSQ